MFGCQVYIKSKMKVALKREDQEENSKNRQNDYRRLLVLTSV